MILGIAKTGSGKTLTFLVPALLRLALDGKGRHSKGVIRPRILILAPTRELAMQSLNVVKEIGGNKWCLNGFKTVQCNYALVQVTHAFVSMVVYLNKLKSLNCVRKGVLMSWSQRQAD